MPWKRDRARPASKGWTCNGRKARAAWAGLGEQARKAYSQDITFGYEPQLRGHWLDRLPAIDQDIAHRTGKAANGGVARHEVKSGQQRHHVEGGGGLVGREIGRRIAGHPLLGNSRRYVRTGADKHDEGQAAHDDGYSPVGRFFFF